MELLLALVQVLAIFIALPALAGIVIATPFLWWNRRVSVIQGIAQMVCRVDTDCPLGYVCRNGVCVPAG